MDATNYTISLTHVNTIMPLISLMSAHFLVNSFKVISDMEPTAEMMFMKSASNYFLEISQGESANGDDFGRNTSEGYIVYEKRDFDLFKVVQTKPKLVVGVYRTDEITPLGLRFITELVIPPSVSFFVVLLQQDPRNVSSNETPAKCFRLYKPSPLVSPKSFPVMRYGGPDKPEWMWESKQTTWNSFERDVRDMSEVTLTIALASLLDKSVVIHRFWSGKNSFFWKLLAEHLKFRTRIHFQVVPPHEIKNMEKVFLKLLATVADGLGFLPVMTSKRLDQVDCIITGLDSKNHVMVRTPQYIHSWQSIFKPLASDSWVCLGIAFLLISVALKVVTFSQKSTDFSGCCLTIIGIICGQGCPNIPKRLSGRLVCYTCILFSILIYQFYTSNFYSLLSTKEVTLPFNSLEQFVARKTHSMYVHPDTAIYADIKKAKSGPLKQLWDEFLSKDPSHQLRADTRGKIYERVCKGKGAVFGLPFQTLVSHDLMCKLVTINSGYFPTNIATAVRKNFPFKPQFQFVHMKLLEAGISHKYGDDELHMKRYSAVKTEVTNEPVSLEHVAFLFVFHSGFVLFSGFLLGLEIISSKIFKGGKNTKGRVNKML